MKLDHLAVAGETLAEAVAHVEDCLGVDLQRGGQHALFGTHNQLLGLNDGLYLEAIAIDPAADMPARPRWFDLDRFIGRARLSNWILRSDDLQADLARLPAAAGQAVPVARGDLRWRMAVPDDGILPMSGCFPALIQWQVDVLPADRLGASGCRLERLEIAHPEALILQEMLALSDPRIAFVAGEGGLRASFQTPHGKRVLQ